MKTRVLEDTSMRKGVRPFGGFFNALQEDVDE